MGGIVNWKGILKGTSKLFPFKSSWFIDNSFRVFSLLSSFFSSISFAKLNSLTLYIIFWFKEKEIFVLSNALLLCIFLLDCIDIFPSIVSPWKEFIFI